MARVGDPINYSALGGYFKNLIRNNIAIVRADIEQANSNKELAIANIGSWVGKMEDMIGTFQNPLGATINILS